MIERDPSTMLAVAGGLLKKTATLFFRWLVRLLGHHDSSLANGR
ncbi:MAG: hypothetical protein ACYTFO_08995 [Planctomycetota bacterium]